MCSKIINPLCSNGPMVSNVTLITSEVENQFLNNHINREFSKIYCNHSNNNLKTEDHLSRK